MNEFTSNSGWLHEYIASEFQKSIRTLQIAKIPSDSPNGSDFTTFLASDGTNLFPLAISSQEIDNILRQINQQDPSDLIFSIIHPKQLKPKQIEGVFHLLAINVSVPNPGEIDFLIGNPQPIGNNPVWIILQRETNTPFVNFSADYMKPVPKRSKNPFWKYLKNRSSGSSAGDDEFYHEHVSNLRRSEASPDASTASFAPSSQPISLENQSTPSSIPNTQTSIASRTRRRTAAHRVLNHLGAPSDSDDGSQNSQMTRRERSDGRPPKRNFAKKAGRKASSLAITDHDNVIEDSELSEIVEPSGEVRKSVEMDEDLEDSKDDSGEAEEHDGSIESPNQMAATVKSKRETRKKSDSSQDLQSLQSQASTGNLSSQNTEGGSKKRSGPLKKATKTNTNRNKTITSSSLDLSILVEDSPSEHNSEEPEANVQTPPPSGAPKPSTITPFFEEEDSMFPTPLQNVNNWNVPIGIDFDIFQTRLQPQESDNESDEEVHAEDSNPHLNVMDILETSNGDVHADVSSIDTSPDILQTQTDFARSKPLRGTPTSIKSSPNSKVSRVLPLSLMPGYRRREEPKPSIEISSEVIVANSSLNTATSRPSIASAQPIPATDEETHTHGNSISTPQSLPFLPLTTPHPHFSDNTIDNDSMHGEFIEEELTDSLAQPLSSGTAPALDNVTGTFRHLNGEPKPENEVQKVPDHRSAQTASARSGKHKKKQSFKESSSSSSDEIPAQIVPIKAAKKKKQRSRVGESLSSSTDSELDRYAENLQKLQEQWLQDSDSEDEQKIPSSKETRVRGSAQPSRSAVKLSHKKKSTRQDTPQVRSTEQSSSESPSSVLLQRNRKRRKRSYDAGTVEDPRDYYTPQQKKIYIPLLSQHHRRKSLPAHSEYIASSKKSYSKHHRHLESSVSDESSSSSSDELTPYQPPPKIRYKQSERKFAKPHKITKPHKHSKNARETMDILDRQFSLPGAQSKSQATYGGLMAVLLGSSKW